MSPTRLYSSIGRAVKAILTPKGLICMADYFYTTAKIRKCITVDKEFTCIYPKHDPNRT